MTHAPSTQPLTPGEALHRHTSGDRSLEVMSALNHAAWEAYHAPWEVQPTEFPMDEPTPLPPLSPTEVRPITPDLLAAWLEEAEMPAFRHPKRVSLVDFKYGLRSDRCVQMRLYLSGKHADVLVLQWTCDKRIPPDQFVHALRLCNWWNNEYRWPRAMVEQDFRLARRA
ncbi:hypothetical protein GETHOR_08260 [Geothrix oryzae]|uniref:Uncharacterized protein n=1 Tax=Geothrix oryzae TaxID=2927975 RepID=A0ABN6UVU8_9BACT|nr:YbjN domain-containing protein [Geothrix oryzae]BDU68725.1 hypothetical protein GETHOR_08260 [Geothrix oryzae]